MILFIVNRCVIDYFRWRNEDAHRNALNAHCYWNLRKTGMSSSKATNHLSGLSVAAKNELLFKNNINYNELPNWQKRGIGMFWEDYEKEAKNPKTDATVFARRRKLKVEYNLPMKDDYDEFIK